ncbi:unnamed protein product [Penicillium discolor]
MGGEVAVAGGERLGDRAVLGGGGGEPGGLVPRHAPHADEVGADRAQRRSDVVVGDRVVEGRIESRDQGVVGVTPLGPGEVHVRELGGERGEPVGVTPDGGEPGGGLLQRAADLEQGPDVVGVEVGDDGDAGRLLHDQTVGGQATQSLPQRRPAHTQALGLLHLAEHETGRQLPGLDAVEERRIGTIAHGRALDREDHSASPPPPPSSSGHSFGARPGHAAPRGRRPACRLRSPKLCARVGSGGRTGLAQFDHDHAGEHEHAPEGLQRAGELAEQEPAEEQGRHDLGERDERGQPGAEHPRRDDAEHVREGRGDHADREDRHEPRHRAEPVVDVGRRPREREHADERGEAQTHGTEQQPTAREGDRRDPGVGPGGQHEVARGPHHRPERPEDTDDVHLRPGDDVEHEDEPDEGDDGTEDAAPRGTLAPAQPEPEEHRDRGGVLDEQRDPDVHQRHGLEVAELGGRDGEEAVGGDHPRVLPESTPPPAKREDRGDEQHERRDPDPHRDGGPRRPPRIDESARPGPGGAEREGGGDSERQAEAHPGPGARSVISHGAHEG